MSEHKYERYRLVSKGSKREAFIRVTSSLTSLYSLNTFVLCFALFVAFIPQRPDLLLTIDKAVLEYVASPQQKQSIQLQASAHEADGFANLIEESQQTFANLREGQAMDMLDQFLASNSSNASSEVHNTALTPVWFSFVERLAILIAAILMLWGLKRISALGALGLVTISCCVFLGVQSGMLVFADRWIPLGVLVTSIVCCYFVMQLQVKLQRRHRILQNEFDKLGLMHARSLADNGYAEDALETLRHCTPNEEVIALVCAMAEEQLYKKEYEFAKKAYLFVLSKRRHPEAKQKLVELAALDASQMQLSQHDSALEATMVVSQNAPLPKLGRYEVKRELGRGAMGIVYLGMDPKISRELAIKTFSYSQFNGDQLAELRERFFSEAKAAGRLSHPNIVTVYDVGEEKGLAYIAMDYINGIALDAHCRKDMLLPVDTVYHVILQVAEALSYAHSQKIIHRDIKPSNLIYSSRSGQVMVSDFGIARISDESKTKTGHVMGSPLYMSPEQLKGRAVTGATDIFSLGATMYQLLTGLTPFVAENLPELTIKIMSKKHKSVRELRPDLPTSAVRITNKALHKDPAKRYQSAEEMADHLRKALASDFKARVA
jgi:tRNA A-37 threonylcarbamoyl transferase component Bud32